MRWVAMGVTAAALAGCAATPAEMERQQAVAAEEAAGLEQELAGLTPSGRSTCLPTSGRTQVQTEVYGSAIVYRVSRNLKYVNETTGGCDSGGARDDILITGSPIGRACSGDIVQTVDRVARFPTGSCALGDFVAYRRQ